MSIPVIESSTDITESGTTSFNVALPSGTEAGDLLVAIIAKDDEVVMASSHGFTKAFSILGGDHGTWCWWKIADADDITRGYVTFTGDNEGYIGRMYRITGHNPDNPIAAVDETGATGVSDTPQAPSINVIADVLVFAVTGMDDNDEPYTLETGGWTADLNTSVVTAGIVIARKTFATAGATGAVDFTTNASDGWAAAQIAINGNFPPTVDLNTPADEANIQDTTPDLKFTGTDPNEDEIEYEIQIDPQDTFDSEIEDDIYIYCAGGVTQKVWKIRKSDMVKVGESDNYGGAINKIIQDDNYIYCGGTTTKKVWKIRKSDMVKVDESDDYGGVINVVVLDDTYIYCGGATTKKVWKIQKSDMVKVDESNDYGGTIYSLVLDDNYIYCGGATTKKVWKIQKSDMVKVDESDEYGRTIYSLVQDNIHVYCGGHTTQKVWKIRKSDMVKVDESDDYGGTIYSLVLDNNYIYCGGATQKVWKIQKSDMVKVDESNDYGGLILAVVLDDNYIYCGGATTKKVWKIQKSDMVKVDESDDYGGSIYSLDIRKGPLIKALSEEDPGFSAGHPFTSGEEVTYTVQDILDVRTYYWRVKAKDPNGNNEWGAWSDIYKFILSVAAAAGRSQGYIF